MVGPGNLHDEDSQWLRVEVPLSDAQFSDILAEVEAVLARHDVSRRQRCSISSIVLEYLVNASLHGTRATEESSIFLSQDNGDVVVGVDGCAAESDAERMEGAINLFRQKSADQLRQELFARPVGERQWETPGASLGLLTIATLATKPMRFERQRTGSGSDHFRIEARVATGD